MCWLCRLLRRPATLALVLGLLSLCPGIAQAGWVGFRNETNVPVVVQITHVVRPREQHGKPHLIQPGNVTWEAVMQPGAKRITVYNANQPRQVLYQGPLLYAGNDLFFAVQLEAPTPGMPVPLLPKLTVQPAKAPTLPGQTPPPGP